MRIALDLFSGTGAATAAFRDSGWIVFGVDNDPCHANYNYPLFGGDPRRLNVLADVRRLPFDGHVDFIWSSPPCNEFSTMPPGRDDRRPSLDLIFATLTAVRDLRPRFWIMENVRGAIPFIGLPRQKIGPFCLWGYFPKINAPLEVVDYRKMTDDKRTAIERAAIPYALSRAVLEAVERSWDKKNIADLRPFRRHRQLAKLNRTGPTWRPTSTGHAAAPAKRPRGRGPGEPAPGHGAGELASHVAGYRETATGPGDLENRPRGRGGA